MKARWDGLEVFSATQAQTTVDCLFFAEDAVHCAVGVGNTRGRSAGALDGGAALAEAGGALTTNAATGSRPGLLQFAQNETDRLVLAFRVEDAVAF